MLELKNIKKSYLTGNELHPALNGINIKFRKSEFVSILGPSGCGKTTLLNIIGGLDHYTDGDLIINGKSTKDFTDSDFDAYRNHSIGFVFQSYNLIPHQTVLSNVELALTLSGVSKSERRRRAVEALKAVGLEDQIKKKPNQMSGGQMQRVAIARALVNNPDILLADEPTGALDSATSVQIMEILKNIAEDKLVIMVTHNPELAERYSTRIIKVLDGKVIDDTKPYEGDEAADVDNAEKNKKSKKNKKPSMSLLTALSLSLNNLMTKKTRTFLTSFAGSIGIIGIALILAVSTGVNNYINSVQEETLSSYPLTIMAESNDMMTVLSDMMDKRKADDEELSTRDTERLYANNVMYDMMSSLTNTQKNNLKDLKKFLDSSEEIKECTDAIIYSYDAGINFYTKDPEGKIIEANMMNLMNNISGDAGMGKASNSYMSNFSNVSIWSEMLPGEGEELVSDALKGQYDVVYGNWPKEKNEVVLVINQRNEISDYVLYSLGIKPYSEMLEIMSAAMKGETPDLSSSETDWSFEEICKKEYKMIVNADKYVNQNGTFTDFSETDEGISYLYGNSERALTVKISGIIKLNEDVDNGMLTGVLGYTSALTDYAIEKTESSEVVVEQLKDDTYDVITGKKFEPEVLPVLSDSEKAEKAKSYIDSLNDEEKYELYVSVMTAPTDEYVSEIINTQLSGMTREQIEETIAEAYSSEMGISDISQVLSYMETMSDEEFTEFVSENMKKVVIEQYTEAAKENIGNIPSAQLIAMFEATAKTDAEYAVIYDKYIPSEYSEGSYEENLKLISHVDKESPVSVNIYVSTFNDKDKVAEIIEGYNADKDENDKIKYTDYFALLMSSISTVINAISYVLIAFVAISLVVSSIMIGIITYISVLERTKEIGILRAIGASKRDISRVFNAETLIVGFAAGVIGIGITLLLTIPINIILYSLTDINNLKASLPWLGALILVAISMVLTFISGLIPSGIAAKKDPVESLRTE